MRFLLDNDVDVAVSRVLRSAGHDAVTAAQVGLAGRQSASDDEITVYADDRGMVVLTHDREFTARRKRNTVGLHVRLACEQPDAAEVVQARLDELIQALGRTEAAVVEVTPTRVRWFPPHWR